MVSANGFVSLNGGNCYIGESFAGVEVALEREEKSGLIQVRYANVKLGSLENSTNARLRPPPYLERWKSKTCQGRESKV